MTVLHPIVAPAMIGLVGGQVMGLSCTVMGLGCITKADIVIGDWFDRKTGLCTIHLSPTSS